jgi:two-component system sensor histidine kinase YesM
MRTVFKRISAHKFFLKNLLFYSLIIIAGIGLTTFFILTTVIEHLIGLEGRYEREILERVANDTEEKFKSIDRIFSKLRFRDYFGLSIADLLNPEKNGVMAEADRSRIIRGNIQNLCYIYPFITDFIILDYPAEKTFFYSNDINRDILLPAGFFQSGFIRDLKANPLSMGIIADSLPDFIKSYFGEDERHVISVYSNLTESGESEKKLATVIVTLDPQVIRESYRDVAGFIKGKIMVTDGNGLVIFDSSGDALHALFDRRNLLGRDVPVTVRENDLVISVVHSAYTNFNFINVIKKDEVSRSLEGIAGQVVDIIALCIIVSIITTVLVSRLFMRRINRLTRAMRMVETGDLSRPVAVGANDEIGYIEKSFNSMCRKLEEYIRSVYISHLKMKTSELKALQAQINPHFMFNTLESIRLTALTNDDKKTAKMIHILGNLFRWNIRTKEMIITVSDELEYLESYVELQKIRYAGRFGLLVTVAPELRRFGIPKLLLQPLVENAIHHGIGGRPGGETILVEGRRDGETVKLAVEDHGAGIPQDKLAELRHAIALATDADDEDIYNIGLRNVHQRIRLLFGEPFGLELTSTVEKMTIVTIVIPALAPAEMKKHVQGIHR